MKTFILLLLSTTFVILPFDDDVLVFMCNTMQPKKMKKEPLTLHNQACINCKDIHHCKLANIVFIHTFHM
jgi:hypothetical protein